VVVVVVVVVVEEVAVVVMMMMVVVVEVTVMVVVVVVEVIVVMLVVEVIVVVVVVEVMVVAVSPLEPHHSPTLHPPQRTNGGCHSLDIQKPASSADGRSAEDRISGPLVLLAARKDFPEAQCLIRSGGDDSGPIRRLCHV